MNNRLYIGGLPYSSTEDDLKNHFAGAGTVIGAQIIIDRNDWQIPWLRLRGNGQRGRS
jgi:RNA recognition motif-containing protein